MKNLIDYLKGIQPQQRVPMVELFDHYYRNCGPFESSAEDQFGKLLMVCRSPSVFAIGETRWGLMVRANAIPFHGSVASLKLHIRASVGPRMVLPIVTPLALAAIRNNQAS